MSAELRTWLPEKASPELTRALGRLVETEDVVRVAVMPDAHLAEEVCVGTVTATRTRILPAAVGGDIGCGMLALRFDAPAERLADERLSQRLFRAFTAQVPCHRHPSRRAPPLPEELLAWPLSKRGLEAMKEREARLELGTLGRGNHFLELQRDDAGWLWLMLHSGSRALGPAVRAAHERAARRDPSGLAWLPAEDAAGRAYLSDAAWAGAYARWNRRRMADRVVEILGELVGAAPEPDTLIECDHNHVRRERSGALDLWVHRKGAMAAPAGALGVIPGSMGSASFHVRGRGLEAALSSASHGAGRVMSRAEARRRIDLRTLERETRGVWLDPQVTHRLREEAPSAYKDIGAVMRSQRELVRVLRRLQPVLVYKGS